MSAERVAAAPAVGAVNGPGREINSTRLSEVNDSARFLRQTH